MKTFKEFVKESQGMGYLYDTPEEACQAALALQITGCHEDGDKWSPGNNCDEFQLALQTLLKKKKNLSEAKNTIMSPEAIRDLIRNQFGNGLNDDWQITHYQNTVSVSWDWTFRRNTRLGEFKQQRSKVMNANSKIETIADWVKKNISNIKKIDLNLQTEKSAKEDDERAERNGDSAYSEYEQGLGSYLKIELEK